LSVYSNQIKAYDLIQKRFQTQGFCGAMIILKFIQCSINKNKIMNTKFKIQENQYIRPYHQFMSFEPFRMSELYNDSLSYYGYVGVAMSFIQGDNIAEVGCGDGKILKELATRHPEKFFEGFDLSNRAILFAKAFGAGLNIKFYDEDFSQGDTLYDTIFCIETLEHISDEDMISFVNSLYKRLKSKGRLIITVPSENLKLISKHYRHYNTEILEKNLKQFLNIKYLYVDSNKGFWLRRILANRLFILNNRFLIDFVLNIYKKKYMYARERDCAHIVGVFTK